MLYLPNGIFNGDLPDPEKTAQEFREVLSTLPTSQYQWQKESLSALLLDPENLMQRGKEVVCAYGISDSAWFLFPGDGGEDPNLYQVPFNCGLVPIENVDGSQMALSWTSKTQELLLIVASFQYVHDKHTSARWGGGGTFTDPLYPHRVIRFQAALELDGTPLEGSGPFGIPILGRIDGTADGEMVHKYLLFAPVAIGPGAHTARILVGTLPNINSYDAQEGTWGVNGVPLTSGVMIGTRGLYTLQLRSPEFLR